MGPNEALKEIADTHNARQPSAYARGAGEVIGTLIGVTVGVALLLGTLGGCMYLLRAMWRALQ